MAVAVREAADLLGPEEVTDAFLFRWNPPSPPERQYPRWSLLGVTDRRVAANADGTWTVTWTWRPWLEDSARNPQPHPAYVEGRPGPVPRELQDALGLLAHPSTSFPLEDRETAAYLVQRGGD